MTPPPDPETAAADFETSLTQLGEIVTRLESGSLGLSASIDAYERGVAILRRLHQELAAAEERVHVLVRIDDEGRPILEPAETAQAADSTPPTAPPRGPRAARAKQTRPRSLPGMDDGAGEA